MADDIVQIHVRHSTFSVDKSRLLKFPESRLARDLLEGKPLSYNTNPSMFENMILDLYTTNEIHIPLNVCAERALQEMTFWGVSESMMSPCCFEKLENAREKRKTSNIIRTQWNDETLRGINVTTREKIYNFLEYPQSSKGALAWCCILMILVMISVLSFVLETLPQFKVYRIVTDSPEGYATMAEAEEERTLNVVFRAMEWLVLIVLILDYILRFATASVKSRFCLNVNNLADFIALLPYALLLVISPASAYPQFRIIGILIFILKFAMPLRLLLLLKLMAKFQKPRVIFYAIKHSLMELFLVLAMVCIATVVFATLVYLAEADSEDSHFVSIPAAMWWAIVTLTTVGYGDMRPITRRGQAVASFCAVTGIVLLALIISIISRHYVKVANALQGTKDLTKRKRRVSQTGTNEGVERVRINLLSKEGYEGENNV